MIMFEQFIFIFLYTNFKNVLLVLDIIKNIIFFTFNYVHSKIDTEKLYER